MNNNKEIAINWISGRKKDEHFSEVVKREMDRRLYILNPKKARKQILESITKMADVIRNQDDLKPTPWVISERQFELLKNKGFLK